MTIGKWIADRDTDCFIIEDSDGNTLYEGRRTIYDPAEYIMCSLIVDIYTWKNVTVLSI